LIASKVEDIYYIELDQIEYD